MLFPTLGPSSLPIVVAQPDEIHANRTMGVGSGGPWSPWIFKHGTDIVDRG